MIACWARLRRSAFARDTAILSLGAAAAQALALVAVPVMSRLYAPADFGHLAAFTAVSGIVATAVTLRYETAVLLPADEAESRAVVVLALGLALALGLLLTLAAWALAAPLQAIPAVADLGGWFPVAVLAGVGTAVVAVGTAWLSRQRAYTTVAGLRVAQSALFVGVGVGLGWLGASVAPADGVLAPAAEADGAGHGLMLAQGLATLAVAVFVALRLRAALGHGARPAAAQLKAAARQHGSAPRLLLPTALLDVVSLQVPVLLILARLGSEAAGQYSMAWRILALPATLVGAAVGQVFFERISAEVHQGLAPVRRAFERVSLGLAALALPPTVLLALWGEPLFGSLLGAQWRAAGAMAEVLVFSVMMYFVFSPTSSVLIVLRRQSVLLGFGVWQLIYRLAIAAWAPNAPGYIRLLTLFEFVNVVLFVLAVRVCLYRRDVGPPAA